ncbi:peptidase S9 [Bacteroidia bacterium]|nr:peptidase S9 [Bacteroidia bacterium]
MKKILFLLTACIVWPLAAQKPLTVDDLAAWKRVTEKAVSDDGKWIIATMEPWRGDATLYVYNQKGEEVASFATVKSGEFALSSHLLITKTTPLEETEALKIKKTKDDKMPMDQLVIYNLQGKQEDMIDSIRSYKLSEGAPWLAYQNGRKDSTLYVRSLDGSKTATFPAVSTFFFSKENQVLYYISNDTTQAKPGLYAYQPEKEANSLILEGKGVFKQTVADEKGEKLAFLYCPDKDSTRTQFALYLSEGNNAARKIAERTNDFLPSQWVISENGKLSFTKHSRRLFFGIAPEPKQKDTTILASNRPDVQVWNWNEDTQYTVQNYNRADDLKKTYTVAYNIGSKRFVPLTTPEKPTLQTIENDNVSIALVSASKQYGTESMWTGHNRANVYTINLETGETKPLITGTIARLRLSPQGKYAYWYSPTDSSWYTYSIADAKTYRLTTPSTFTAWNEENDVPDYPNAHGAAGWTADDAYLLINDRYDIWQFSPTATSAPVNLTVNGRKERISYRRIQLDKDETFINLKEPQLLKGFNEKTKGSGYYSAALSSPAAPKTLLAGDYMLTTPLKAKKADAVIYTSETYSRYPEVQLSDLSFKRSVQLTKGGSQQAPFLWGTAELTTWTSLDGKPLEGVIYKPANFDPSKKYPVVVNFYERNSETLYSYHMPEVGRSTIDYHFYNSNGYIIFNPDIVYEDGYPGESCFKSVMPGIASLIAKGYVDEKAIAAQGHSWGGYQDAYLATRTNLFAAIESGAPVVNMFSAYGGIRWGSGLNRSFQYEHTQSRIGGSIWETPLRYIENSPLFDMDKVQTPILIMANDNDGHVPWYQGIEFFVALKRLQKPAWLLNYMGEPHWPLRMANKIDFQTRMFQFFEHYLKGAPMPKWMSEGVPATERDFELGY